MIQADRLVLQLTLFAAIMLHLLTMLYASLPEVGDAAQPKLALVIDEAHLLFRGMPDHLLQRVEQIARLVRSKGVALVFVTQSRDDLPNIVVEQLATRIDHARRLGVGRAHVTALDSAGRPKPVEVVQVDLPSCRLGPLTEAERSVLFRFLKAA